MTNPMRPKGPNEFQLSFLVPNAWVKELDELAQVLAQPGLTLGRSDVLRMCLRRGIDAVKADRPAEKAKKR
jgi:hypothetical protein